MTSLFQKLPEEILLEIRNLIFEDTDDYPEDAHRYIAYQIYLKDPDNYQGDFEYEFKYN